MGKGFSDKSMNKNMMGNGNMTSNMEQGSKFGQMEEGIRVNGAKGKYLGRESSAGPTGPSMRENAQTAKSTERGLCVTSLARLTQASLRKGTSAEQGRCNSLMESVTEGG